jgi:predicted dehydrogenase
MKPAPLLAASVADVVARPAASPGTSRARLGFLGLGWIGLHRLRAAAESGACEVVAFADPASDAFERARALAPDAAACRDLDELLGRELDGLVIATPNALHADPSIRALERGLAVFCQKPLARTAAEARRVVDAARRADRLLGVDLCYRHLAGVPELRERIRAGELGRVFALDLAFHNAYGPDKAWFYDRAQSGGGCLIDLGVHLVDLALWLLDFPRVEAADAATFAAGSRLAPGADAIEDYAEARLALGGGAIARIACSWRISAGCDALIHAWIHGTRGGAKLENVGGSFHDFAVELYRGRSRETLAAPPDDWGGRALVGWARRVAEGARFDPEAEAHVLVAETIDRMLAGPIRTETQDHGRSRGAPR